MHRKCHMEIPHHVFHEMETIFGDLKPLFLKFAHTHIHPKEVEMIVTDVNHGLAANAINPPKNPYKNSGAVKGALNGIYRSVTGDKRLEKIREVYLRSYEKYKKTFLRCAKDRYKKEITHSDIDSSWRDFTVIYPDNFDGDNIRAELFHSYKFNDVATIDEEPNLDDGHLCHSIQALIWRITGLYKECCKEPDAVVSERSKVTVVEELIRLSHYVMDLSTIVHLMYTKGNFHKNFEKDLDNIIDEILPKVEIKINEDITDSFYVDAFGEADKRARLTFKKFYFPIIQLYGKNAKKGLENAKLAFSKGKGLKLAEEIIQNACQNLADFWGYTMEQCDVAKQSCEDVIESDMDPSQ